MKIPMSFYTPFRKSFATILLYCMAGIIFGEMNVNMADAQNNNAAIAQAQALFNQNASGTNTSAINRLLSAQVPDTDPALLLINRDAQDEKNKTTAAPISGNNTKTIIKNSVEADYARRSQEDIKQITYADLVFGASDGKTLHFGAIWKDYVIGVDDELVVTLRGGRSATLSVTVDREGRITLPDISPISVAGRTFEDVSKQIETLVQGSFNQTTVHLSLGRVRAVNITVVGEVERPGTQILSSLSTVAEAIAAAGGIRASGSLRSIRLIRGHEIRSIDLYPLLLTGDFAQLPLLQDGDRIVVDTLGSTIAIVGDVIRPGIYELARGTTGITAQSAIEYAGGLIRYTGNAIRVQRLDTAGRDQTTEIQGLSSQLRRNDIVYVRPSISAVDGYVGLFGAANLVGRRSLSAAPTVFALLEGGAALTPHTYTLMALLETHNPKTFSRQYIPINLVDILNRKIDVKLETRDSVYLFSRTDISFLTSDAVVSTLLGKGNSNKLTCEGLIALNASVARGVTIRTPFDSLLSDYATPVTLSCPEIFDSHPELLLNLLGTTLALIGETNAPGLLPIAPNTQLSLVIDFRGGITNNGDMDYIEVMRGNKGAENIWYKFTMADISRNNVTINPGDTARIARRDDIISAGYANVSGQVKRPGRYGIRRGEKLSELLHRAGGLTSDAYPYGAVFRRLSVQNAEKAAFARAASELRSAVPIALKQSPGSNADPVASLAVLQGVIQQIENTPVVGRVVIEADPVVLQVRPDADFVLEAGDDLWIPKRPAHVTVSGEVLMPSAVRFTSGQTAMDYIRQSGGIGPMADLDRAFVVLPNGIAERIETGFLRSSEMSVPPGSIIIVPREASPFDMLALTTNTLGIFSSLAITAASIAAISRD